MNYSILKIIIKFQEEIIIRNPIIFTFRSIIGKELKKICCLFKRKSSCEDCSINQTCPYSFYFESPQFEKGNKKPHPYTMFIDIEPNKKIDNITIYLTLIGDKAISYFPYLFFSLDRAGERGIFREREKFEVIDVVKDNKSILINKDKLNMDFEKSNFEINTSLEKISIKNFKIKFISPIRLKRNGKLLNEIDYNYFIKAAFRRIDLLTKIYGKLQLEDYIDFSKLPKTISEKTYFEKLSYNYYSSRQKRKILLIGVKGYIEIKKEITFFEESLLQGAEIFGVGANTTFGFGKVKIF